MVAVVLVAALVLTGLAAVFFSVTSSTSPSTTSDDAAGVRVPDCQVDELAEDDPLRPVALAARAAYDELGHPAEFSPTSTTQADGCAAVLRTITYDEAAARYRLTLPQAGWTVVTDGAGELLAGKGSLKFALGSRGAAVVVLIGPVSPGKATQ